MGSSSSTENGESAAEYLHFYIDGEWKKLESHEIINYFRDELRAEKEIINFAEIRKHNLSSCIPGWMGYWHEYTLVETTNWHWSLEKTSEGIYLQRSRNRDDVRSHFGGQKREFEDRTEGRSSQVSFGENILDVMTWIINRNELSNLSSRAFDRNSHFFASLLYEAITRTKGERRLDNTE